MYSMYTTTCVVTTFAVNVYRVFILNIYVIKLLGKLNISYDHNLSAKGLTLLVITLNHFNFDILYSYFILYFYTVFLFLCYYRMASF